ncbi:alpha/beta-hydrolase [Hesseltinella vesiculosa]|uniref:Alpha/beta-hydrolase n=1 Tax=Hesseltinella vesiculosa TaxID=101127 RepID=A0A1X2G9F5_9FUNG|nr:alpha/beta-hydrolase [Hesseltinella vesiculosa]
MTESASTLTSDPTFPLPTLPAVIPPTTRFNFLKNWWQRSAQTASHAEGRLLQRLVPVMDEMQYVHPTSVVARSMRVPLGATNNFVNTFMVSAKQEQDNQPRLLWDGRTDWTAQDKADVRQQKGKNLVICHGYGAGLGFFYKNYYALANVPGLNRLYAIDWLGMGRSSRPKWTISKTGSQTWDDIVDEVEHHFVESLEQWRESVGLETMTLMGHSLGGYFSTCYALKYPERVEKLILVSPAGIPAPPEDYIQQENPDSTPQELLEQEAKELGETMQAEAAESVGQQPPRRRIPSWARYLWDHNITPMSIVRAAGPFGASLVNRYTSRRFAHLTTEEQHELYDYIYQITSDKGSGEYALAAILKPGAYARRPLFSRLAGLKMPTIFVYGEDDWMDYRAAEEAQKTMKVPTKVLRVPYGGHHMYLDNPDGFNEAMQEEI